MCSKGQRKIKPVDNKVENLITNNCYLNGLSAIILPNIRSNRQLKLLKDLKVKHCLSEKKQQIEKSYTEISVLFEKHREDSGQPFPKQTKGKE